MRHSVQQKIDKFTALAATAAKTTAAAHINEIKQGDHTHRPVTNNLSLSIRNKAEAEEFLTALNAIVQAARTK
ncbi:hypothetical protein [Chitinophaga arvensicola]|uniref:Uncharacterized protein n=1 Tax=Chitinophaga arvensicola TaxID=29529 RepID=A0A1I0REJ6_9BACT|nr:hypothetical protein [Chitinophaga arvensicola]SEW39288.1 hypothetical protein SAMN04488122_2726 [Chitinophaga arvensicola]